MFRNLKKRLKLLKRETYAIYLVYRDSRVSWWRRAFLALVIGYAFSPIDLIPDFIPILGYLDDLIIVPLGIAIALKLIPAEIMDECRKKAYEENTKGIPIGKKTAVFIIFLWIIGIILMISWLLSLFEIFFINN
ncbi:MAG: YkvA family protein [Candidatus Hodarchaeales archaeon]|jgi:uncharacterized membrane protein YkvA (DUF1232 family)